MAKDRLDTPRTPDRPAYEQVKDWIRGHIASGDWKPGDPVPSEAALMGRFGVSRMTAHRALRELATEGLVTRVQGSGTTVAQLHRIPLLTADEPFFKRVSAHHPEIHFLPKWRMN